MRFALMVVLAMGSLGIGRPLSAQTVRDAEGLAPPPVQVEVIEVTGARVRAARQAVQPPLGATINRLDQAAIAAVPGGVDAPLNQTLQRLPGVAGDSFGQLHVRGEHANLQFRLNGIILPEGISGFGQALSPRLADKIDLITGALPAQYGLRTAGIVDITTKEGAFDQGGNLTVRAGGPDDRQIAAEVGGMIGGTGYFLSGTVKDTGLGLESPDGRTVPLHDQSRQGQGFLLLDHGLDADSRLSLILGVSRNAFEIPNRSGLQPMMGVAVKGMQNFTSDALRETQKEITDFGAVSYILTRGTLDLQASVFGRLSSLQFRPDRLGDLLFTGIAEDAYRRSVAAGAQLDGSVKLGDRHTARFGFLAEGDRATGRTLAQVLPVDAQGQQTSDRPQAILDESAKTGFTYGVYGQDSVKLTDAITLNGGARYDLVDQFIHDRAFSPRASLVYTPDAVTTIHAGYARYFTPPPFALIANTSIQKFVGTTAAPLSLINHQPKAERADYIDLGITRTVIPGLTVGLDAYLKKSRNLIDEGQFGAPIILTAFNYAHGTQKGLETVVNYTEGPFGGFVNLAVARATGRRIVSSEFNVDPGDLAVIAARRIPLDHDQIVTLSTGVSYRWGDLTLSGDLLHGSGLRADGTTPNGRALPDYTVVNLSLVQKLRVADLGSGKGSGEGGGEGDRLTLRLDVANLFDARYEIRDGTGVGVGAPQFGARRGVFGAIGVDF